MLKYILTLLFGALISLIGVAYVALRWQPFVDFTVGQVVDKYRKWLYDEPPIDIKTARRVAYRGYSGRPR